MKQLPEISETLESVMEYFAPMAKSIHPDIKPPLFAEETMHLTRQWLDIEFDKAYLRFLAKREILP